MSTELLNEIEDIIRTSPPTDCENSVQLLAAEIYQRIAELFEIDKSNLNECKWDVLNNGDWAKTECGGDFCFYYDIRNERNNYKYCPKCGRKIKE